MKQYKIYTIEKGIVETDILNDNLLKLTWHREDGPAFIEYVNNGNVAYEVYYVNGKQHRLDGPASIFYAQNSNIQIVSYYINGKFYSKKDYNREILEFKFKSL